MPMCAHVWLVDVRAVAVGGCVGSVGACVPKDKRYASVLPFSLEMSSIPFVLLNIHTAEHIICECCHT